MNETVLVVDDEPLVLSTCKVALSRAGYNVIPDPNGNRALQLCRSGSPRVDLALLDAVMPGVSAAELASGLRALGTKIVLMSGYLESQLAEQVGETVLYDKYLPKPFHVSTLLRIVRETIGEPKTRAAG